DRHQRELLPRHPTPPRVLERRVHLRRLERQVLRDLVSYQHGDLVHKLLEVTRRRVLVAQDGELVLNQRMRQDGEMRKLRLGHGGKVPTSSPSRSRGASYHPTRACARAA